MGFEEKSYTLEIPGTEVYELPPLCISGKPHPLWSEVNFKNAQQLVREDELISNMSSKILDPKTTLQSEYDLAVNIAEQYRRLQLSWRMGDDILGWVRQCETTFGINSTLNRFLSPNIWPHVGRVSFIQLLEAKSITERQKAQQALGLRLAFRRLPPLRCLTDQFLLLLGPTVTNEAYDTWKNMTPPPTSLLPAERFTFQVFNLDEVAPWT